MITERTGLPLSIGVSAANTHDSQGMEPLVRGIPPICSRRGPRRRRPAKLHADKGYDYGHLRGWLRSRNITPRIARRGIESSQRLGRHRWTVERTVAWLAGCRRLHRRYERKAEHFLAFAGIAVALICFRRLGRVTGSHGAEKARVSSIELSARVAGDTEQLRHGHGATTGRGDVLARLGGPQRWKQRQSLIAVQRPDLVLPSGPAQIRI